MYPSQQIEQSLKDQLGSGRWPAGSLFFSEMTVARDFDVSRLTARKALHALCQQGHLESARGKGYIVRDRLERKPTHTLGTVLFIQEHFNHPVVSERMAGLQEALRGTPYAIKTFTQYDQRPPQGKPLLNMAQEFSAAKLDGLNTQVGDLSVEQMRALSRELVIVCNNWFEPDRRWSYIQFDIFGAYVAVLRHLAELGHRHIAVLHTIDDLGYWSQNRPDTPRLSELAGLAAQSGIYLEYIQAQDTTEEDGAHIARHVLSRANRPTAIIATEEQVIGIYRTAENLGLDLPHELSLVGTNDLLAPAALPLPLSAIHLDHHRLGQTIGEEFLRMLGDPQALGRKIILPFEFRPGQSCVSPPARKRQPALAL